MKKTILVNWADAQSIKRAERKKSNLENAGYNLIKADTIPFTDITTLHYQKK